MNGKTFTLAALAASLLVGASATATLARDDRGPGRGHEGMFIRLLQDVDSNKDGKVSKEEAKAAEDKMFAEIDADKDGALTPGEMRKHREAMMEKMKAEGNGPGDGKGPKDGPGAGPKDGSGPQGMAPDDDMDDEDDMGPPDGMGPDGDRGPRGDDRPGWGKRGEHHGRHGDRDGPRDRAGMDRGGPMGPMGMMRRIDTDENGQISKAEASAAIDKMFERMDTNTDGAISADDFPKRPFWR